MLVACERRILLILVFPPNPTSEKSSIAGRAGSNVHGKRVQISRLHIYRPRTHEPTGKTFTGAETGDDATRGDTFHFVLAVPCHKMAVVDIVRLSVNKLNGRM